MVLHGEWALLYFEGGIMRNVYRVLALLVAAGVMVQAAAIASACSG